MEKRKVAQIVKPRKVSDGAGVNLLRAIGSPELNRLDPFLLLDEFKSDSADDYIGGFPPHPHRGFETVTYMLAGAMRHKDNTGESGDLIAGSVQWMTAGRGIIHSEMPRQENGLMWGFQLWVNLPAKDKMCAPKYRNISPEDIPVVKREDGTVIKVIAGEVDGVKGAVSGIATEPFYLDVSLPPDTQFSYPVPKGFNVFAYILEGEISFDPLGAGGSERHSASTLAVLGGEGEAGSMAGNNGGRFLLIGGKPIGEKIARHGPFVMNTRKEIEEAIEDYQSGKF